MTAVSIPPPVVPDRRYDIVFLDRDGTINVRVDGYVRGPAELELLPGAGAAVAALNGSGVRVVVLTNQRGLATGDLTQVQLDEVHRALAERLERWGAHVDAILVCPHDEGSCDCRKPLPGLFHAALRAAPWAHPSRCVMVGDMASDVIPALSLGIRAILVGGEPPDPSWERAQDLQGAVGRLLDAPEVSVREPVDG